MTTNQATLNAHLAEDKNTHRWMIIITIMMLSILEVLDSTIVNVSLHSMMASLGADQNQITWVLTSYVVASAIVLPLTGFLTQSIGRRRFLMICASGFMLSSFLCGASTSLTEIVIFRVMQGACGASLIPISQTILRETFPPEEQGKAMAIWGLGILAAPVCGPTLGGYITEYANWRWVFYINLPFCLIGLILIMAFIPKVKAITQRFDVISLLLMVTGVGALQIFLDKGNDNGWFQSNTILSLCVIAVFSIVYFIVRNLLIKNPLINLRLFKDRNFSTCCLLMLLFCGCVFSFITIQPILLENYFHYSTVTAGLTMGATGLSSALSMLIASRLMPIVKVKYLISVGLLIASAGLWHDSLLNLEAQQSYFLFSNFLIGSGMGLIMVCLSSYVFSTLPPQAVGEASGLFSYSRMVGTSVGISLISTLISQLTQTSWHSLTGLITPFGHNVTYWLQAQHLHTMTPLAITRLTREVTRQSNLISFIDAFRVLALTLLIQVPIALSLKSVKLDKRVPQAH